MAAAKHSKATADEAKASAPPPPPAESQAPPADETTPATPEAKAEAAPPAPTVKPGLLRCRVWQHGALEHDGVKYLPGTELKAPAKLVEELGGVLVVVDEGKA